MAVATLDGYNFKLKLANKTIIGVTSDEVSIAAKIKESITKDNSGAKQKVVTGHDWSFKISALVMFDDAAHTTTMDRDDILDAVMATGAGSIIAATYEAGTNDKYGGNVIIAGYTETTPADPDTDSTLSLDIQSAGAWAKIV